MKCPECGTINEYGFKYCRECGYHLPEIKAEPAIDDKKSDEQLPINQDILDLWQLYESKDLEKALEKCNILLQKTPESASIHSLAAIVYERIAENEKTAKNNEAYNNAIKQAIKHYEEILKFNTQSSADKAKLFSLKNKLISSGNSNRITSNYIIAFMNNKKAPLIAAVCVFVIVLVSGIFIFAGNKNEDKITKIIVNKTNNNAMPSIPQNDNQHIVQNDNYGYQDQTEQQPSSNVNIQPQTQIVQQQPQQPKNNYIERNTRPVPNIEPLKIPAINNIAVQQQRKKIVKPASVENSPTLPEVNSNQQSDANDNNDASSMLARAFELRQRGEKQLAIAAAEKAIDLYEQDKSAGKNADISNLGIRNAQTIINDLSQSSD